MEAAKCMIKGSDYIGVFATANDKHVFHGAYINDRSKRVLSKTLGVTAIEMSIFATDLIGLFVKANSKGILISNLIEDYELERLKAQKPDLKIGVLNSNLNAIGNNILTNNKIAIVNPEYTPDARRQIQDVLDVEVVSEEIGGFKTVGANNILTDHGFVINNKATDDEKYRVDTILGFNSTRTTANTGSLNIGLAVVVNSRGVVAGDGTTGFELNRILEALDNEEKVL